MTGLRWFLGITATLAGAGWLAIAVVGGDFRRSFGASPVGALTTVAPPVVMLLAVVTVLVPTSRWVLHASAVVFAFAAIGLGFVLRESLFVGITGLLYLGAWFLYYWRTAWP